jgi:mono/diheme cytochrome c family protein
MRAASILSVVSLLAALGLLAQPGAAQSAKSSSARAEIARGKYLVEFGGCIDCHTPGYFFGKPDMPRALGGSEVGFEIPGLGVFYGPNLTPDKDTGLGNWTKEQIVTALQKGTRPDGRQLVPIMPWKAFAKLTKADANAIAAYLQSLAPLTRSERSAVLGYELLELALFPIGQRVGVAASQNKPVHEYGDAPDRKHDE